jgi:hypothetical protein
MGKVRVFYPDDGPPEWKGKIEQALEGEYCRREFDGLVSASFDWDGKHFVYRADLFVPGVGAVPDGGPMPQPLMEDYTARIRPILERIDLPLE